MSETVETHDPHAPQEHEHPGELLYFKVAALLFVLTGLEVSTYYVDFGDVAIPLLLTLMVIKFFTVAAYFMHLKFDSRLFSRVFVAGLVLAVCVYVAALSTFAFWF